MSDHDSNSAPAAVVLLSGGLDSATTAAIARAEGFRLYALSVDYGQRHRFELEAARRVAAALGVARHVITTVDLGQIRRQRADRPRSTCPRTAPTSRCRTGFPITYVPARNTVLLSLALGYAEVVGAADLFIGVNAVDYSGYPDCRPEFIAAFEQLANLATKAGVEGHAAVSHPHAADQHDQGRDHSPRHGTGRRLRPDAHLLRPERGGHRLRPLRRLPTPPEGLRRGGADRSNFSYQKQ